MAKNKQEFISEKSVTILRDLKPLDVIHPEQIKAARSLLDWSQADLAKKSGYSLPAINNIERGIATARPDTIADIQQTFEQHGVQFIDGPGVRIESNFFRVKVLEGANALPQMFANIRHVMESSEGEILLSGIDEKRLTALGGESVLGFQMKISENKKVTVKTLCFPEQDMGITFAGGQKRLINFKGMPLVPCIIYKDRVAFVFFENPFRVMILSHQLTAETMQQQFHYLWDSL